MLTDLFNAKDYESAKLIVNKVVYYMKINEELKGQLPVQWQLITWKNKQVKPIFLGAISTLSNMQAKLTFAQ